MQLRFVSVISITFLLSWIVGLILCWRSIFHSRGDETVYNPTRRVPGRELSRRVPYNRAHNQTRERKRRRRKKKPSHVEEKLPLPIFNVGFPKAGTSSVFSFFQRQGFRSQHWYCCKQQVRQNLMCFAESRANLSSLSANSFRSSSSDRSANGRPVYYG